MKTNRKAELQVPEKPTPSDFIYLWNLILRYTKKIGEASSWPIRIVSYQESESLAKWLDFVVDRINKDNEFRVEVKSVTGYDIEFFVEHDIDTVIVKAKPTRNL